MAIGVRKNRKTTTIAQPPFSITASCQGERRLIRVTGELDLASRDEFFDACIAGTQSAIEINLRSLTFMDCGGYSGLVKVRVAAEANGRTVKVRESTGQPNWLIAMISALPAR